MGLGLGHTGANEDDLEVTQEVRIPAADLSWTAVRAPGPGGQNVNKVATKIDLRFDLVGTAALTAAVKRRLEALPGVRLDRAGCVVITSSASRSQSANLQDAREKLAVLIRAALVIPKARRRTRPSANQRRRRVDNKRMQGRKKAERSSRRTQE